MSRHRNPLVCSASTVPSDLGALVCLQKLDGPLNGVMLAVYHAINVGPRLS